MYSLNSQAALDPSSTEKNVTDTVEMYRLYHLAEDSQESDSLASFRHAYEGLALAASNNNAEWQSRMHQLVGQLMFTANQPDSCLHHYEQALAVAEQTGAKREIAKSNFSLAKCHAYYFSSFAIAFNFALDALHIWEELGDKPGIVASYYQLSEL